TRTSSTSGGAPSRRPARTSQPPASATAAGSTEPLGSVAPTGGHPFAQLCELGVGHRSHSCPLRQQFRRREPGRSAREDPAHPLLLAHSLGGRLLRETSDDVWLEALHVEVHVPHDTCPGTSMVPDEVATAVCWRPPRRPSL